MPRLASSIAYRQLALISMSKPTKRMQMDREPTLGMSTSFYMGRRNIRRPMFILLMLRRCLKKKLYISVFWHSSLGSAAGKRIFRKKLLRSLAAL